MIGTISALDSSLQAVATIPPLSHAEAGRLSQTEYERLLESLSGADWQRPTYCTEWTVREMVAHLAGAVAGSSSYAEFKRQNVDNTFSCLRGMRPA